VLELFSWIVWLTEHGSNIGVISMASISSLGVGSGLDLGGIVDSLVAAERAPAESRLNIKEQRLTTELSAFGVLRSSLALFQNSLSGLKSSSTFDTKAATQSDLTLFSASVTNTADVSQYSVEVTSLAGAHALATGTDADFSTVNDSVGTGTLNIKFGTTSTGAYGFTADTSKATQIINVSVANNNTSLSGLRDYINNGSYGVKAAIVNDGSDFRMVLTSDKTGVKNSMEITVTGDADGSNVDNMGLSRFAFNSDVQGSSIQTTEAKDAALLVNGLSITRDTNSVSGAINGVTLNLLKAETGKLVNLDITENKAKVKQAISGFVQGYNDLLTQIDTLTDYTPGSTSNGVLIGDFTVNSIANQLRNTFSRSVDVLSGDIRSLSDIGISTSVDGVISINEEKLDKVLSSDSALVKSLFIAEGRPTDSDVKFGSATSETKAGTYSVSIDTVATQGSYSGSAATSLTVDANNDQFTLKLNGSKASSITLAQATYTSGAALAAHLQAQINDSANLKLIGASVTVSYDSNNQFQFKSNRFGSISDIEFISVDTNVSADFGLTVGSGIKGIDTVGKIDNQSALGSGHSLSSYTGNSSGLNLTINTNTTGSQGNVRFSRGIADTLDTMLKGFLDKTGFVSSRESSLTSSITNISDERATLNLRVKSIESRLIAQFSALDGLVARFQSTSSFLTTQLKNMPNLKPKN
jgi:flagellar hook-associated protein 2